MENLVLYCKTYRGDRDRFANLLYSFHKYNKNDLKFYISAPESDLHLFEEFKSKNVFLVSDESYCREFLVTSKVGGIRPGYVNAGICKLNFYRTNVCKNYLCLDSDSYFIRDFYFSDFMYDENTPYTVLVMDKELSVEKTLHKIWVSRQKFIEKIYTEVGLDDKRLRTSLCNTILSCKVLDSLYNNFMISKGYDYKKLMEISVYEVSWYNAWFQKCGLVKEYAVEHIFKIFAIEEQYLFARIQGQDVSSLKEAYVGIVMNNKWRIGTPLQYKELSPWEKDFFEFYIQSPFLIKSAIKLLRFIKSVSNILRKFFLFAIPSRLIKKK